MPPGMPGPATIMPGIDHIGGGGGGTDGERVRRRRGEPRQVDRGIRVDALLAAGLTTLSPSGVTAVTW